MEKLKCFISAPYEIDTSNIKNVLAENDVETFDIYDFSIGESIQQILKRKLRQSDFAIFIVAKDSANVVYEMGVCEGLGKQHFIFIDSDSKLPFYVENQLFLRSNLKDREFIKLSVLKIIDEVKKNRRSSNKKGKVSDKPSYNEDTKQILQSYLPQIKNLRLHGTGKEMEFLVQDVFRTIKLNYVENQTASDRGVDFAIWNDELGKVLGNPIIVELKYGKLTDDVFTTIENQIIKYINQSDAKLALLLYLDKTGRRFKIKSTLYPLVICYDLEDFVEQLIERSFEKTILNERNKIAHGLA